MIPQEIICRLTKPAWYLGNEINSIHKDILKANVKFAIVFPDLYEIGMSNQGVGILYGILNSIDGVAAERVYVPKPDFENILIKEKIELCSLESYYPLKKFDIVGFSIQYEMSYTSILHILALGKIPFKSSDRGEDFPLVIGGGPSVLNCEPIADFFDLFVIGDGEEVIVELVNLFYKLKQNALNKSDILFELSKIEGIYIPAFFKPEYDKTGQFLGITSLKKGYSHVKKRTHYNINKTDHLLSPLVPFAEPVHDRMCVEIDRGCTQGCRFCQAGYICRPLRERDNEKIVEIIDKSLKKTGYEDVTLSSLSAGMHKNIDYLIETVMDKFSHNNVAISFPSIRPDSISNNTLNEILKVRKTGFTLAPEAGSQRLRDIINKNLTEDMIINSIITILSKGWNSIKLYFMIGLPFENMEDIKSIYTLYKNIINHINKEGGSIRLKNINISISCFVPKPHTTFQRNSQNDRKELLEKQKLLTTLFRREKKVNLKMHDVKLSFIEAVFARGDRRLGKVIEQAYNLGCKLDSWTEFFDNNKWNEAFKKCGINPNDYANRQIGRENELPWGHIKTGVSNNYLEREYKKAENNKTTQDCRFEKCNGCGLKCFSADRKEELKRNLVLSDNKEEKVLIINNEIYNAANRYKIKYEKKGNFRFLSHLDFSHAFYRACRRAQLPLKFSEGYHPHPKISFDSPLPLGVESSSEVLNISLKSYIEPDILMGKLNSQLPNGLLVSEVSLATKNSKFSADFLKKNYYLINSEIKYTDKGKEWSKEDYNKLIDNFLNSDRITFVNKKGKAKNIRPFIDNIIFNTITKRYVQLNITLIFGKKGSVSPYTVLHKLFESDNIKIFLIQKLNTVIVN